MKIPLVRLPIDPLNIFWIILEPSIWRVLDRLPLDWGTFGRFSRRGWQFEAKADAHLLYGPIWALVTPCDIYVNVADPDAIGDIFDRRADFLRPTAPFNESVMKFVWNETLKQSREMVSSWTGNDKSGILSVAKDTRTLSLNVLAATGFRRSYTFQSSSISKDRVDEAGTYRDALQTVLDSALILMLIPPKYLRFPFLPSSWTHIGKAAGAFKQYMVTMLDDETSSLNRGEAGTGSLMTSFVRALNTSESEASKGLTVDEIFGNIFVINFAGHDTTANTLAFAMLLLASHPEVQNWVSEEVLAVTDDDIENWEYGHLFSNLKRCRAVLVMLCRLCCPDRSDIQYHLQLETLRLYPPIPSLPKWTTEHARQKLQVGEKTVVIPPHTGVMPSLLAMQTHPNFWPEPLKWKPSRWISPDTPKDSALDVATRLNEETVIASARSTYFPWSDGPQNCPGAKFAQVEFVAVIACIFRRHRMHIVLEPNESWTHGRERALATTEDCDLGLLLRMRDADRIRLACTKG
ncbi:MAG: hypothetical protein Q9195_009383 [Heterodermia aff. obscurata]